MKAIAGKKISVTIAKTFFKELLWTAPELLRMTTPIKGSPKADVYSFAIIMQEILFRAPPYFASDMTPERNIYVL